MPTSIWGGMKSAGVFGRGSMTILMILAALAFQSVTAPTGVGEGKEPVPAAMASALANKARVKSAPSFVKEPDYIRPQAAVLAGEFGEVVLSGIIGEDGRLREARVAVSSRSATIDAAALAAVPAMLFAPARDAGGRPLSIPATLPLEYSQTDFRGERGLARYRCAQFVRDYDWWYRTWPADRQDRVFKTLRGYAAVADLRSGKAGDFASEWKQAIEACRGSPDKLMIDMLKTHGALIRAMVGK